MVRETDVARFYTRLRSAAFNASSSPVLIFPSARDTDSLCAFKILTLLLKSDSVRFSAFPVANSSDISILPIGSSSADSPAVILLINWGASQDLLRLLKLGPRDKVFVVDSHRPIHLQNLNSVNSSVVVLYTNDDADIRYHFNVDQLADFPDFGSDSDEHASDDDDEFAQEHSDGGHRKRSRGDDAMEATKKFLKSMKDDRAFYYGNGCFYGKSSGVLMYEMSSAARKSNNDILWLACVAITDQYVHERLTPERYQSGQLSLELALGSSGGLDRVTSAVLRDGTRVRVPDVSRIVTEFEPRLMLLREWTLFDSMLSSSYVATKLRTWTDTGLHTLKLLLAGMGISLKECKGRYQHMNSETKKNLKAMFEEKTRTSGLTDLFYKSFNRYHGYSAKVSAADVVYAVTALLESESKPESNSEQPSELKLAPVSKSSAPNKDAEEKTEGGKKNSLSASCGTQFWDAFKALNADNMEALQRGMRLAIKVQRAIVQQGSLSIARKGIRYSASFRTLKLELASETELLAHPLSLTRLCYFLMDALKQQGTRPKPMIIAAPVPRSTNILIVGVANKPRLGENQANKFGLAFGSVAEAMGANFSQYAFESSWITLDKDDVNSFMLRVAEKLRA